MTLKPTDLPFETTFDSGIRLSDHLKKELAAFREFGQNTRVMRARATTESADLSINAYINEFWTSKQRAGSSLHEVSYRACFKPQLPRFFIERLTSAGDRVYDPFAGRGTTLIESALLGRCPVGCDLNPLSEMLTRPRLTPPRIQDVAARLEEISLDSDREGPAELLAFYHPETLGQLCSLRDYFLEKTDLDCVDRWIRMVAINRLTGHSSGFFSVYTLPPNQAVSVKSQLKINKDRNQVPDSRDVAALILKKSRSLLRDCDEKVRAKISSASRDALMVTGPSSEAAAIESDSISLVVTSPPFLDVVDYVGDNWLRCWFAGIDPASVKLTVPSRLEIWRTVMTEVLRDLKRVLKPGGHVAFEVGEVRGGKVKLDEEVVSCGMEAGLDPRLILINDQQFTKTANCWGVKNNLKGTNTNRVVLFEKLDG